MICVAITLLGPSATDAYAAVVPFFSRNLGYDSVPGGIVANGTLDYPRLSQALSAVVPFGVRASYAERPMPVEEVKPVEVKPYAPVDLSELDDANLAAWTDETSINLNEVVDPVPDVNAPGGLFTVKLSGAPRAALVDEGRKIVEALAGSVTFRKPPTGWQDDSWCIYVELPDGVRPQLPDVSCTLEIDAG